MSSDSPSNSETYGEYKDLSARLDAMDTVSSGSTGDIEALQVTTAAQTAAIGALQTGGGSNEANQAFIGYGASPGAFRGYPVGSFGGPVVHGDRWVVPDSTIAFQMSPNFPPIGQPTLHSSGQTAFGPGSRTVTLTGTLFGPPDPEVMTLPIVTVPTWARSAGGAVTLNQCSQLRIRWINWPDGAPGFLVVQADLVDGFLDADGNVTIPTPPTPPEGDGAYNAILVDFMLCEWSNIAGQPPAPNSTYEAKVVAPNDAFDVSAQWPDPDAMAEDDRVLVQWLSVEGQKRGIFVLDSAKNLTDGNGQIGVPEVDLFDGNHDGSIIWADQLFISGVTCEGRSTWGVYTTEFCSLVQLSGPNSDDPTLRAPTGSLAAEGLSGTVDVPVTTLVADLGFIADGFLHTGNPGYGRFAVVHLTLRGGGEITVNITVGGGGGTWSVDPGQVRNFLVLNTGAPNDEFAACVVTPWPGTA